MQQQEQERYTHRRAQIIDRMAEIFETLLKSPEASTYPIQVETVRSDFIIWTDLDGQDAIPAIVMGYGDGGSAPDAPAVGFTDEQYPIAVYGYLKHKFGGYPITHQASDLHHSIDRLLKANKTLGVDGVEEARIRDWRSSEESEYPFLILKFRVYVVHRYHGNESV